jgi:MraZ protein
VDPSGKIGQRVYFGSYNHTIDAKGRTSLPAKFRETLAANGEPRIVLMQSSQWRAVRALPQSIWQQVVKKVMGSSPFDARMQRNILKYVSTAQEIDLDPVGRVLVPPPLREWAALAKDVVWVGVGPHMELFDKAEYEKAMATDVPEGERVDFLA